jgi:hypothetical protein
MKWMNHNQVLVELDSWTTHSNPGPLHAVVWGFSRYRDQVESLDVIEIIRLRVVTDFIVGSFDPGCLPITGIHVVGHADTDFQRGKAFEQLISETRARNVQSYLKKEIDRLTWPIPGIGIDPFKWLVTPPLPIPAFWTAARIDWKNPRGVGATDPDPQNRRRGKTPQNMTEEDRKRNRWVEIVLEPGDSPLPGVTGDQIGNILDAIFGRRPVPPPPPIPPLPPWMWDPKVMPQPGNTDDWRKVCETVKQWLKSHHTNPGPFLDWLKGIVFRGPDDRKGPFDDDFAKYLKGSFDDDDDE